MRCLRLLTLLAVFLLLTQTNFGQYKKGAGDTPQDYTSIAKVSGTADGTGVSFQNSSGDNFNNFAGTFNGTLNDNAEKFYCIDLYHPLATNQDYWDEGRTPSEITYILNNFFPFTDHPNALSDNNEAAAVQLAIWSFSDDAVISSIGNSTIKNRAQAIVDETNANHEAFLPVETLEIVPVSQTLSQGTPAQFSIVVKDINGDGVGNVEVSLSTNKGNLSTSSVTTNSNGEAGPITLTYNGDGTATITANAEVVIPQGTRYVHKADADGKQKLVLATPAFDEFEVYADVTWECSNTIGNFVWHDQDTDGKQDANEPGIEGVVVELIDGGSVIATDVTDANGYYEFTNIPNGTYTVKIADVNFNAGEVLQNQNNASHIWFPTFKNKGSNDNIDSDGDLTNHTASVTVDCNDDDSIDFGFFKVCVELDKSGPASVQLGDQVTYNFEIHNCGDVLLSGGARLYDAMLGLDGTNNTGSYFQIQAGGTATKDVNYTPDEDDCGELVNNAHVIGSPVLNGYNFGNKKVRADDSHTLTVDCEPCKNIIGDFVWHDQNTNGKQDNSEPGIEGVVVQLLSGNTVIKTTTTNASGYYEFTDVENGTYTVKIADVNFNAGQVLQNQNNASTIWFPTFKDKSGVADDKDSDGDLVTHSASVTLDCNDDPTIDFGFFKVCVGLIKTGPATVELGSDATYHFEITNCGDVLLSGGAKLYDPMLGLDGTNNTGSYFQIQPGNTATKNVDYTPDADDCGELVNDAHVIGSPALNGYNFGGKKVRDDDSHTLTVICKASIGDKVWKDLNENGIQDNGEPGVEGVTVKLYDCNNTFIKQTQTNSSGNYLFDDLTPGDYYVQFVLPNGFSFTTKDAGNNDAVDSDADVTNGKTICTTLEPAENDLSWDAGLVEKKATLGDRVWMDLNKNGIQDNGEPGVEGVTVKLFDCNDNFLSQMNTNNLGEYLFTNLTPGDYYVQFVLPAGYKFSPKDQGNDDTVDSDADVTTGKTICTSLEAEETDLSWDAGIIQLKSAIGDKVFNDLDKDGIQDNNEPGVPGVVVKLYDCDDNFITQMNTNSNGEYLFDNLTPGDYYVEFTLPSGFGFSPKDQGNDDAKDSDADVTTGKTICTTLAPEETDLTWDAGIYELKSAIGDKVFNDLDKDGIQDNGEPGVPDVTVKLFDCNNNIISQIQTNGNGEYLFDNLTPGDYYVEFVLPSGFVFSPKDQGGNNALDSDADESTGKTVCTNLAPGETDLTWDAGIYEFVCEGVIGDRVWLDFNIYQTSTNCNGIQDEGEPGLQGVKVILKDSEGNVIDFTFTDEHGNYLFEGLCTDNDCYTVHIDESTLPNGTTPTAVNVGSDDAKDSDGSGVEVCLTDNHKEDLTIDFGFCTDGCGGCEEACIGDFVWFDANENGIQDNNESGIQDVVVKLFNENGTLITETTTDEDGYYRFDGLIPGRYYVQVIKPAGFVFTTKDAGNDDELDSDVGLSGRTATTLFVAGYCDLSWDAGLVPEPASPSCLGDRVFFDKDNDGIQDIDELGVANVEVKLLNAGDNSVIATTTTDYAGNYKFDNLTAGSYKVEFVLPDGYTFSPRDAGSDDELDSDAKANGRTVTINLGTSECQLFWDAGIYRDVPDLRLNKVVDNPNPEVGEEIKFTITVTNDGPGNATGVEVTDYFPTEGVSYNSYTASQGSFNSGSGVWTVGNLSAGQSATLDLFFTVEEFNTGTEFTQFDLGVASDYNVFALCSVNFPSSDSECKVAVGWDAYLQAYSVGDKLPSNSGDALVVGRNLTFVSGAVYNGNVVYGISTNLPQSNVSIDGDLIQDPNRIDFGAAALYLKSLSAQLSSYAINGTTTFQWGTLTLEGTHPTLNVFEVSGDDLTASHTVKIDVPNGSVVVVNISGNDITWTGGLTVEGTAINNVLYNFYEATFITIEGIDIQGSVLAPCATIDFKSGVINGQMIAKYIIGRGQFNCEPFLGNIPGRPNIINIAEITHVDQEDPDSTPNNGVPSEDDYAVATVYFENNNNGGTGGTGDWQTVGQFGLTEVINTITADLNGNLLAATAGGNLHISYNGGIDWTLLNEAMTVGIIWDIAVGSNGYIYLATEQGIFASMDGGTNWIGPMGGLIYGVNALEIDPVTGDIYAAVWGFGIYKSTNNGTSWSQVNAGLTNMVVNSLINK
jgi:choice-of-anchor A domain-containing protein/uncharacterized repeat protein (TIGR01451 family)